MSRGLFGKFLEFHLENPSRTGGMVYPWLKKTRRSIEKSQLSIETAAVRRRIQFACLLVHEPFASKHHSMLVARIAQFKLRFRYILESCEVNAPRTGQKETPQNESPKYIEVQWQQEIKKYLNEGNLMLRFM